MPQEPVVQSIAYCAGSIGASAARHLDFAMREPGAVDGGSYLQLITGEQHPFGNMAVLSDADSQDISDAAVAALLDLEVPTMALYTTGVSDSVAQHLGAKGFSRSTMPAMAIDIERLASTGLQCGYVWARIGAGKEASEWSEVLAAGYGLPVGLARMFSPDALGADMADNASTQFLGVRHDGRLVATSMLLLSHGLAGIYCVATLHN